MLILPAGSALSEFRREKLLEMVNGIEPTVVGLDAHYFFLVQAQGSLDALASDCLVDLLDSEPVSYTRSSRNPSCYVVPRLGTISPWSTKATDIVRRCGLLQVLRIERGIEWKLSTTAGAVIQVTATSVCGQLLYDPMVESLINKPPELARVFSVAEPGSLRFVDVLGSGRESLVEVNEKWGLALSFDEVDFLFTQFQRMGRNPTDAELMMFAQVNSEHCRHKIFNANWKIDSVSQPHTLFSMIRSTHEKFGSTTLVAYNDNAAVIPAPSATWFGATGEKDIYQYAIEPLHIVAKVETHNHPTAISPFPGAATGSGGEIRDEGATGRGAKPRAGLTGFSVSNLHLPGAAMPWEMAPRRPQRIASPLQIMIDGPLGGAAFNNEFGRPNIGGYFRTFEVADADGSHARRRGYHKPIMLAGGIGNIREGHVYKETVSSGTQIIVLGGPAMLIGLGGGAASSVGSGKSSEQLDFSSVQRGNPEMQRRCQEVIDRCTGLGAANPIVSIHDVGAGGLSNAVPELVEDSERGGAFYLRQIPNDDLAMSPMEIWCNEAQERYVIAVRKERLTEFESICLRENCPYSVVGEATAVRQLRLYDGDTGVGGEPVPTDAVVDVDMQSLFGQSPPMLRDVIRGLPTYPPLDLSGVSLEEAIYRVLHLPTVADKTFLITIGDRSVSGQIVRDQMVGPWQVPVADVAVSVTGFVGVGGEAMAMGERAPLALINPAASARMAVAEALTNLAAADVAALADVRLSANWMAAVGEPGEDAALYDMVYALTQEFLPALGISVPVGKDSLSMATRGEDQEGVLEVVAPVSLVITAFSPVMDVRRTLTPMPMAETASTLILLDLGGGRQRLGGSALAQVYSQVGDEAPDLDDPIALRAFFAATRELIGNGTLLAYHDRSDGGLFVTLCEMAFAGRCGLEIELEASDAVLPALFAEEAGAVFQVRDDDIPVLDRVLAQHGIAHLARPIAKLSWEHRDVLVTVAKETIFQKRRADLHRAWSESSYRLQALRDDPICAQEAYDNLLDEDDPGLHTTKHSSGNPGLFAAAIGQGVRPRIAILREQGVNGHLEMAAAFDRVGFEAVDVTMGDLVSKRHRLEQFVGMAACGGFSFGDVLGAGRGWAKTILLQPVLKAQFAEFFLRSDTFALGVCNGCQMLSGLKSLIPGAARWPVFVRNRSEQFEARLVMTEIMESRSILFRDMSGTRLPVVVSHGEGQVKFDRPDALDVLALAGQLTLRYVDNRGLPTVRYPANPNGSVDGITGLTSEEGRVTILMPHPERIFRTLTCSWHPPEWGEDSPWLKLFENARAWVD